MKQGKEKVYKMIGYILQEMEDDRKYRMKVIK